MLKFYGIRFNQNGAPERFTLSFAIGESLHAGLQIIEQLEGNLAGATEAVDKEIEKLFQGSETVQNSKRFRFLIAKWFRTKDIVRFLLGNSQMAELKLAVARVLDTGMPIAEKWGHIESHLLKTLTALKSNERNEQLSNSESEVNLTLQMVSLFFMEQDDEIPPANLELQFIRYQFPRIIWKKKDGFNSSCNPFWLPKNMHCRPSYLQARVISKLYEKAENAVEKAQSIHLVPESLDQKGNRQLQEKLPISYTFLLPAESPDEIRLLLEPAAEDNRQLSMIPESAPETMLSLQKMVQKQFSHDGVRHLLGILRQLAGSTQDGHCLFDVSRHLQLVAKESKKGEFTEKQAGLFKQVFDVLKGIKVKRLWKKPGEEKETVNPFILELCTECTDSSGCDAVKKLLLDPLFLPGHHNPFHLGIHLRLIPPRLFRESIYKHALLPGLASYLTGTWLNEFAAKRGVASKTTREIVEGCAFNLTPANQYRIIDKVKSELAYMEEKCYVSTYSHQQNEEGNPWDDLHNVTASENVLASIAEKMRMVEANRSSEKRIA